MPDIEPKETYLVMIISKTIAAIIISDATGLSRHYSVVTATPLPPLNFR